MEGDVGIGDGWRSNINDIIRTSTSSSSGALGGRLSGMDGSAGEEPVLWRGIENSGEAAIFIGDLASADEGGGSVAVAAVAGS